MFEGAILEPPPDQPPSRPEQRKKQVNYPRSNKRSWNAFQAGLGLHEGPPNKPKDDAMKLFKSRA